MRAKYRVYYTEFECGWGQRQAGHEDFDSLDEATTAQTMHNLKNNSSIVPTTYIIAEQPVLVDLDNTK